MARITYKEFCSTVNENPIKAQTDEVVQSAVYDWFKYRFIGFSDADKFLDILQRNASVNYPIYKQKLRIEPGVSKFDWLVQVYRERQLKMTGGSSNERIHGNDQRTDILLKNDTHTTTYDTKDVTKKGGSDTTTVEGTDNTTFVEGIHTDNQEEIEGLHSKDTKYTQGLHTQNTKYTQGLHTQEYSPHVGQKTQNGGMTKDWTGSQGVTASLPMSKTYEHFSGPLKDSDGNFESSTQNPGGYARAGMPTTETVTDTKGDTIGTLDWATLSGQSQNFGHGYHQDDTEQTTSYIYGTNGRGDVTTNQGSSNNPDTTINTSQGNSDNPDITEETRQGNSDNPDKIQRTKQGSSTDPDKTDRTNHEKAEVQYGSDVTDTKTGKEKFETSDEDTRKIIDNYGNINDTARKNQTDQEQMTGRNEDPATILTRAQIYIEQSSAFKWFRDQLESCFAPWYSYGDDNDNEEGAFI